MKIRPKKVEKLEIKHRLKRELNIYNIVSNKSKAYNFQNTLYDLLSRESD
jgi:hypothetical protein